MCAHQVALLLNLSPGAAARFQQGLGGGTIGTPAPRSEAPAAPRRAAPARRTGAGCCGGNEYGGCCSY
jgi:hypothetical protein